VVGGMVDVQDRKMSEVHELDRLHELEQFQRLTVGRGLKMIELKKEIEDLRRYCSAMESSPARIIETSPHLASPRCGRCAGTRVQQRVNAAAATACRQWFAGGQLRQSVASAAS